MHLYRDACHFPHRTCVLSKTLSHTHKETLNKLSEKFKLNCCVESALYIFVIVRRSCKTIRSITYFRSVYPEANIACF